jgi:hypothetical protein
MFSAKVPVATSTRMARSARVIHVNSTTPAYVFAFTDQTTRTKWYSSCFRNAPRARCGWIEAFGWGPSGLFSIPHTTACSIFSCWLTSSSHVPHHHFTTVSFDSAILSHSHFPIPSVPPVTYLFCRHFRRHVLILVSIYPTMVDFFGREGARMRSCFHLHFHFTRDSPSS